MNLIHGAWIPDETTEFVQNGAFYLWVETDAPTGGRRRADGVAPVHPGHLADAALVAFLDEKLGIRGEYARSVAHALDRRFFLLPSAGGAPLPAFELQPYVDADVPDAFSLAWWQVCCWRVRDVLATLSDVHFTALHAPDEFQLGTDLLFWYQVSRVLKGVVTRDQYIPALTYRALAPTGAKRAATAAAFEIRPGWEIVSEPYESAIRRLVASMPAVCTAGSSRPEGTSLFQPDPLVRHFAAHQLRAIVGGTPVPAVFEQKIAGTLLDGCVHPDRTTPRLPSPSDALTEYRQWAGWRDSLTRAHTTTGFTLCFRLEEATATDVDHWQVHFLVAAKHDPSLKLSLADYWRLSPAARAAAARPFGPDFEKNLLLALGYAARVYPTVWEGLQTSEPTGFHLTLDGAFTFLKESAWILEDAGYSVVVPAWWTPEGRRRAKIRLKTALRPTKSVSTSGNGALSLDAIIRYQYALSIGGEVVSEAEWRQLVAAKTPLVQFRGQWIELDRAKMQHLLEFWQTHQGSAPELTLPDLLRVAAEDAEDLEWEHDAALETLLARLQDKSALPPVADPPDLRGRLREYQKRGVAWLNYLESLGLNGCLADDMGLGKTLEVIARLLSEPSPADGPAPTLVIAPTSVLGNWRKEIERFAPRLRALVHQGSQRLKDERAFGDACRAHDVVITSFALARLDEKLLRSVPWHRVVVDEAQNIKNPTAAQTRAITRLPARHRLALTGTPVENRLLDLWSIFNFLNPGYLGKEVQFRKAFERPIQRDSDPTRAATLRKLVEPFILRRVKTDPRIIDDLPEKVEQKVFCNLTTEQASLYEAVVKDVAEQLEEAEGMQRRGLILATLLKLKQICNHPTQFLQDGSAFSPERSHKLQRLSEMLEEVIGSEESLLVFTQFTEVGSALEEHVARTLHYPTYYLHGGTSAARREKLIEAFQDPETEPAVFILSLKAGGVGLNLTKANHVFHFDRWWNPAVENQATDRAFRIGQQKNVFVHKFVAIGTVEERIDQMIEDKQHLVSTIVGADEAWLTELDNDTFKDLIALRRDAILE